MRIKAQGICEKSSLPQLFRKKKICVTAGLTADKLTVLISLSSLQVDPLSLAQIDSHNVPLFVLSRRLASIKINGDKTALLFTAAMRTDRRLRELRIEAHHAVTAPAHRRARITAVRTVRHPA